MPTPKRWKLPPAAIALEAFALSTRNEFCVRTVSAMSMTYTQTDPQNATHSAARVGAEVDGVLVVSETAAACGAMPTPSRIMLLGPGGNCDQQCASDNDKSAVVLVCAELPHVIAVRVHLVELRTIAIIIDAWIGRGESNLEDLSGVWLLLRRRV